MSVKAANYVFRACTLQDPTCRAVLGALAWQSRPETPHLAYMRHADLMENSGLRSENGLKAALRRLQEAGELAVINVGGRVAGFGAMACEYELLKVPAWIAAGEPERHARKVSVYEGKVSVYEPKVSVCDVKVSVCEQNRPLTDTHRQDIKDDRKTDSALAPVASQPSLPPSDIAPNSAPKKRKPRKAAPHPTLRPDLDDQAWFRHLSTLPEYAHVKIAEEYGRCRTWCRNKGVGAVSRRRFVNWLGKVEKPLGEPVVQLATRSKADDYYDALEKRVGGIKA